MQAFIRTCQECGHKQKAQRPDPNKELSSSYKNSKCRHCKSEALDYGSEMQINSDGSIKQEYYTD